MSVEFTEKIRKHFSRIYNPESKGKKPVDKEELAKKKVVSEAEAEIYGEAYANFVEYFFTNYSPSGDLAVDIAYGRAFWFLYVIDQGIHEQMGRAKFRESDSKYSEWVGRTAKYCKESMEFYSDLVDDWLSSTEPGDKRPWSQWIEDWVNKQETPDEASLEKLVEEHYLVLFEDIKPLRLGVLAPRTEDADK